MSFVVKATVYMTSEEYDGVEVKRGDIQYIVDYGDRLRTFLGDIPVETLTFADFTADQIDEIKSAAQEAAEQAAQTATEAAASAESSEQDASAYSESAGNYADKATKAEGYDASAQKAAASALTSAKNANDALLKIIAERVLAQSYARGGTGSRPGENTDNAEYYMRRAQAAAEGVDQDWSYIESIKEHVDEVAEQVDADKDTTEGYKDTALIYRNEAEGFKNQAAVSEANALTYKNNAAQSATDAHNSAVAAATSEHNASVSEHNAATSETNADASDTSAQLAAQAAEYARNGAVDAKVLAETAQSAAESAAVEAADDTADAIEAQFRDDISATGAAVTAAQTAAGNALSAQQAASASAVSAQQSAEAAYEYAQLAGLNTVLILDAPPTVNTAAAVGKLAIWHDTENDKNHIYHLGFISIADSSTFYHWEECVLVSQGNVAGGYPVLDANGKVLLDNLPIATNGNYGLVKPSSDVGTIIISNKLALQQALESQINNKSDQYRPITSYRLDYAVRSVLPNVTKIPAATSDYSLVDSSATTNNHSHVYSHSPSVAPTYRLPQVTNTTISHYIELTVDFTNVQTYSFLDHAGEPIVPLFTPSIAAGDVYTFKMEYSAIKAAWLIYPQKQGAVADDFVMRGEVGAANGVAGLDSSGWVPNTQLPLATSSRIGVLRIANTYGFIMQGSYVRLVSADVTTISNRTSGGVSTNYGAITPSNINYAVTAALTDSNHITLNDAQKATAQSVFGVGGPISAIPAATSQYTLSYGRFSHVPELASVYVLPAVADGSITNDITLMIEFSASVLTYEFQDSAGTTLVPLPLNGDIEAGSVVTFLCRYNPLLSKWVIYPVMDGQEAQA